MGDCVFCKIVEGTAPATIVGKWSNAIAFKPLDPVCEGHILVIPRTHVGDALTDPAVTAATMKRAAEWTARHCSDANILTSIGKPATQSIFHLHIHVVPRFADDQLMLPWGTTGDPHDPHWCKVAQRLQDAAERVGNIHEPFEWSGFKFCKECSSEGNDVIGWIRVPYPCPTIRAMKEERNRNADSR